MKIKVAPAGWEVVTPLEGAAVTIEVRRLSLEEKMDLVEQVIDEDQPTFKFTGKAGREVFKKFSRNISGLEFNGEAITKPTKFFTQDFPADDGVIHFIGATVAAFWSLNFPSETDSKNSVAPSGLLGGGEANQQKADG